MMKLHYVNIQGFMSLDNIPSTPHHLPLGDVTVLLGANGSGKSNVLLFFRMLTSLSEGKLQNFVARHGADCLLHYGPKHTEFFRFSLSFATGSTVCYDVILQTTASGDLFFAEENIRPHFFPRKEKESALLLLSQEYMRSMTPPIPDVLSFLRGVSTYQFHDTSMFSRIRGQAYVDDAQKLNSDGGNLAAFLKMLQEHKDWNRYYERIVRHIRSVMPQFGDFELKPLPSSPDKVRLNWRDNSGNEYLFAPHQLSDGSLRFMALTTLLLQPPELLPSFIVMDEPELGLHPDAICELAGMIRMASQHSQILLATQSTRLVDEFDAGDIVIVERDKERKSTVLRQLDSDSLRDWLSNYSLSELWEKNVIGGQP